jgi:1,4-dihydroxy-2-naphthoyl-CoA hydrolase
MAGEEARADAAGRAAAQARTGTDERVGAQEQADGPEALADSAERASEIGQVVTHAAAVAPTMTQAADHDKPFDVNNIGGFSRALGIEFTYEGPDRVEARMPIDANKLQPSGFLHGGATISLLETVASRASDLMTDHDKEYSFGVDVHVRHRKPGESGYLHGMAQLDHEEGSKQFWHVVATDDVGDTVSEGTVMTKIVPKERLAQKQAERDRKRREAQAESSAR